ncbi:MAG: protein kinase [Anaerolineales bacterium]|nr:protein kinase [Anaerolineales bacterium]
MEDWIGRTLSKVEIKRRLGRGGMAEVYLGRHTTLDRPVAVKILQAHLQEEEDLKRRFMAEARSVAGLRHPNIVQVFDYDVVDGRPYIVMELLRGISLADYLTELHQSGLTLPLSTVSRLIKKLASALDYAHERGIIHRDVKPANVMLRQGNNEIDPTAPLPPDVEPILTDFGVARLTHSTTQTATGTVLGTPAYMSPEQVRGADIDSRSDIYSLGIVLYELLSGEPPFNHETTPAAVLVKHLNEDPPPVPQVSPGVQTILRKTLAKNPAQRYQQAGELAAALEAETTATVPPGSSHVKQPTAAGKSGRSFPLACWGIAALAAMGLLAVLAVGGFLGWRSLQAHGSATEAPTPAVAAATEPPTAVPGSTPSPTSAQLDPSEPVGSALLQGSSLTMQLDGVPAPPQGFTYHVWLSPSDEGAQPVSLGAAEHTGEQLSFSHQGEAAFVGRAAALLISLEPDPDPNPSAPGEVKFEGQVNPELLEQLRLLLEESGPGEPGDLVKRGLETQLSQAMSHQGFAIRGIDGGSLANGKLHSEHVINIIEGRNGADYADWNADGRTENPGDDVGLLPYLSMLQALLEGGAQLASDPDSRQAHIDAAEAAASAADQARSVRDTATRIASADTLEEVQPLAAQLRESDLDQRVEALLAQVEPLNLALVIPVQPVSP